MKQDNDVHASVTVANTAHPNIMTDLKLFADRQNIERISFFDTSHYVEMRSHMRLVDGHFQNGSSPLRPLLSFPNHYSDYRIRMDATIRVTDAELDYMLQWKHAAHLIIFEHSDLAYELSQRGKALKTMKSLELIYSIIDQSTYQQFKVEPFLRYLPKLIKVQFDRVGLTDAQWLQFIENQGLDNWDADVYKDYWLYEELEDDWIIDFGEDYVLYHKVLADEHNAMGIPEHGMKRLDLVRFKRSE